MNGEEENNLTSNDENNLTPIEDSGIMLTQDEKRILTNLRRYAKMYPFSDIAVLLTVHKGELTKGTLCLGKGADSNIKL